MKVLANIKSFQQNNLDKLKLKGKICAFFDEAKYVLD